MLVLLIGIVAGGQSLRQQIETQDKSLELNLVRGVHDFNQLQREVNRLRLQMTRNSTTNNKNLNLQLKITQSRFTIIQRHSLARNLNTQVATIKDHLIQSWLSLKPEIQRWQLDPSNTKLKTQIIDQLDNLELDINQVSLLHQRQQWKQYQSRIRRHSHSLQLLSIITILFCGFTLLVGYLLMQFVRARQRLLEKVEQLATIDDVTQIANRRHFNAVFAQEWQRMLREQSCLSLLLCDVDCFKAYNDHYGHQAGDSCLFQIAQTIHNCMRRPSDFAARYGGEEFVIILPHTQLPGAQAQAKVIQENLQKLALAHAESIISDYVTISIGIASGIPQLELNSHQMIEQADQALYQAKAQGRNRACANEF
ncbi:diguanylate cyclase [Acaryochloris sp. CCMEE 5410]|uniref:diguanylate cyclase n=1 Tax=Acaryochloris sp. CCMEE 5410 TaxID=310037 RepID=UPI0002484159|nr:diguanylate cyclase [Acaryochloris sp. CCMEE 5410]